jgi:signal transduction histidine kinase
VTDGTGRHPTVARHGTRRRPLDNESAARPGPIEARALQAAADERRRIGRDLHDGTQQRLVGLVIGLSELASLLNDRTEARAVILASRLESEAQAALDELRALVHGISPPELTDFGLVQALHHIARLSPIPVSIHISEVGRYDRTIEDAVYYTCREALQNAIKHSPDATIITLELIDSGDRLEFSVEDDGPGFAAALPGTGLASMLARVEALGGNLALTSSPGEGTRVHASIPFRH